MFRAIVKRRAMTGSRLHRDARPGQPPGFSEDGWGLGRKISRPLLKTVSHDLSRNEVLLLDILHELGVWKDA